MSSSSASQSPHGHAQASSSRAPSGRSNGKQPVVEDEHSDEEALLADDPLNGSLSEKYALAVRMGEVELY